MEQLKLQAYQEEPELFLWIGDFFSFHEALILSEQKEPSPAYVAEAKEILGKWQEEKSCLFILYQGNTPVGFVRLVFRGPQVPWLEELYIAPDFRRQGLGTQAIYLVEDWLKKESSAEALCLDVVPRNREALYLYHKLGFVDLSLVTLRKEFGTSRRNTPVELLGKTFHM
ncbi:GNAT family N-acetyltransferase [Enterococcus sp. 2201sp1_2201st1_B8_2201SCRN_220225]|uniref:GNAT family N-acetyltransferase n=1 Tax=unclassified Enterococcus TaxID=2608891 RepID=UPI0034A4966E